MHKKGEKSDEIYLMQVFQKKKNLFPSRKNSNPNTLSPRTEEIVLHRLPALISNDPSAAPHVQKELVEGPAHCPGVGIVCCELFLVSQPHSTHNLEQLAGVNGTEWS